MPDTAELRVLNDFATRPGPALYSMAAAARPSIPSEAEVSPRRRGSSSQTRHIGIRGPVRATADTRALKAASVAVDELRYAAPDRASAVRIRTGRQLLSDLGAALSNHPGDHLP